MPVHRHEEAENVLLTTGATLGLAMQWKDKESYRGFDVYSLPLWGMRVKGTQPEQASRPQRLVTVEDHLVDGGFGSWLLESLPKGAGCRDRLEIRGLDPVVCGTVGSQQTLNLQ